MGNRDNHVTDDQRHDELLLRLLERSGQPTAAPAPADLVTRTLRRLPQELRLERLAAGSRCPDPDPAGGNGGT